MAVLRQAGASQPRAEALTPELWLFVFPSGKVRLWLGEEEGWPDRLPLLCSILLEDLSQFALPPNDRLAFFFKSSKSGHSFGFRTERPSCRAFRRNHGDSASKLAAVQVSSAGPEEVPTGRPALCRVDP